MEIVTLIENLVYDPVLCAEHGLSFFIRDGDKNIILDTGQSGNFLHNANVLGIQAADTGTLVISHGHYDHTGGLYPFLEVNDKAMVYAKKAAFSSKYKGDTQFAGVRYREEALMNRLHLVTEVTKISEHVYIMPVIPLVNPADTHFEGFSVETEGKFTPDTFDDELYLALIKDGFINIVTSCSHRGITNICEDAVKYFNLPVNLILGGFHTRRSTPEQMNHLINYFIKLQPKSIGISHCTGVDTYAVLKNRLHNNVFYNYTGNVVNVTGTK